MILIIQVFLPIFPNSDLVEENIYDLNRRSPQLWNYHQLNMFWIKPVWGELIQLIQQSFYPAHTHTHSF